MSLNDFFNEEDETPHIDLSSLIDMMFLLLLFFMVSTTFDRNDAIRVQKADAKSVKQIDEERFKIVIDSTGQMYLGATSMTLTELLSETKRWYSSHPRGAILIIPDKRSPMEPFIRIMDELKILGIRNLAIGANPNSPPSANH